MKQEHIRQMKKLFEKTRERIYTQNPDMTEEELNAATKKAFKTKMKYTGPFRQFNAPLTVQSVDLTHYLKIIRDQENEWALLLAIIGCQVTAVFCFKGKEKRIDFSDYFTSGAVDFINTWTEQNALICNYHNHPGDIAARPSLEDIASFSGSVEAKDAWEEAEKEFKKTLPKDFEYYDWGVVTEVDFFSYHHNSDRIKKLEKGNSVYDKACKEAQLQSIWP